MRNIVFCIINLAPFVPDVLPSLYIFLCVHFVEDLGLYLQLILLMSYSQEKSRSATVSITEYRSRMALKPLSNSVYAQNNLIKSISFFIIW